MWRAHDGAGWWMMWGGALWLLFWVAVAYVVVNLVRVRRDDHHVSSQSSPLDIAGQRYASGEITREEYQQMRDDLEGAAREAPPGNQAQNRARTP